MSSQNLSQKVIPVILCGGSGSRLWPMSNKETPKQFLKLFNEHSLLQNTVLRAMRIADVDASQIVTVTLANMADQIKAQYNEIDSQLSQHILGESDARNTAAAVALAALYVEKTFGEDAVLWILPADHFIGDEKALEESLEAALIAAKDDYLVTFGITPSRPETGYGYIQSGDALNAENGVLNINRFVEKPDIKKATEFLIAGDYLWNSGMFVFTAKAVSNAYKEYSAYIYDAVNAALSCEGMVSIDADLYAAIKSEPFDVAIMEKSEKSAVVPSNPAWSDVGTWESLWEISDKDDSQNVVYGNVVLENAENNYIRSSKTLIAAIGVQNLAIIETDDALLVSEISDSNSLKKIVGRVDDMKQQSQNNVSNNSKIKAA